MISWNEKGEKEVAGRLATTVLGVKPLLYIFLIIKTTKNHGGFF